MTKLFTLSIECENAAFAKDLGFQLAAILGTLANNLQHGDAGHGGALRDSNGNTVGSYKFSEE